MELSRNVIFREFQGRDSFSWTFFFVEASKKVDDDFQSTKIDLDGIRKNVNETDYKFMKRVNRITHQRRVEAGFAAKYHVDIIRDQDTGEIKLKKKPKDEITELMKKKRLEVKNGYRKYNKNGDDDDDEDLEPKVVTPKLTSLQKLKLKKKSKKESKHTEKSHHFAEYQHEVFKFGETVLAPPSLVTPRKAKKVDTVPRPGTRDLLLSSMLRSGEKTVPKPSINFQVATKKLSKVIKGPIDKKGKRKNLPSSTRLLLENEQRNAVDLYRQLKKKQPIVPIPNKNLEDFWINLNFCQSFYLFFVSNQPSTHADRNNFNVVVGFVGLRICLCITNVLNNFHAFVDTSKDGVFVVEPRRW